MKEEELDAIEARAGWQPKGEGDDAIELVAEVRRLRGWIKYIREKDAFDWISDYDFDSALDGSTAPPLKYPEVGN